MRNATAMVAEPFAVGALVAPAVPFPWLAQLAASSLIPWFSSLVMHRLTSSEIPAGQGSIAFRPSRSSTRRQIIEG
jgi:hypothetical protein